MRPLKHAAPVAQKHGPRLKSWGWSRLFISKQEPHRRPSGHRLRRFRGGGWGHDDGSGAL